MLSYALECKVPDSHHYAPLAVSLVRSEAKCRRNKPANLLQLNGDSDDG